jgi:hypothetical protein
MNLSKKLGRGGHHAGGAAGSSGQGTAHLGSLSSALSGSGGSRTPCIGCPPTSPHNKPPKNIINPPVL